ncbi:MAG: hypothetical protein U1F43_17940 [Myxococcota bacterium]
MAMADEAALVRYAYAVAGTVDAHVRVLDVRDTDAYPFAIDLGIAMAPPASAAAAGPALGRVYLPADFALARRGGDDPGRPGRRPRPRGRWPASCSRSSTSPTATTLRDRGMHYLPDAALRHPGRESRLYGAIGTELRAWGGDALRGPGLRAERRQGLAHRARAGHRDLHPRRLPPPAPRPRARAARAAGRTPGRQRRLAPSSQAGHSGSGPDRG